MANIKDIAKKAGVSVATVSRVLNKHPYVRDEKRKRVEEVIQELNYQQNIHAVHLSTGKTRTLGLMIPSYNSFYSQALVRGVMEAAFEEKYSVICCPTDYRKDEELEYLHMLKSKQIDGMIVSSHANTWDDIIAFAEYGPIIACEQTDQLPCVYTDHYAAFETAMNHLINQGHSRIGYCTSREHGPSSLWRWEAYHHLIKIRNLPAESDWVIPECFNMEDGKQVARKWLRMKHRPTALIVNGDEIATGIIIELKQAGLRIPEDLSLLSFDNQPIAEIAGLTTMDQNIRLLGRQAFQLFYEGGKQSQREVPFQMIERESIAKKMDSVPKA
ncbi:DNA-binding LacI/PurR family transcriptional regulator [Paenibacillus shirakamiensis]|uniref:DNA-binding LacI/PurR family transcriptional regulator n=1 Tax=Paenibacillus shirakamiensis TaxID=1265935 RepID=A0ABS4JH00_9BACL|nr:LacI family DNA-binding transcriptional regulator [Paenibacillus shirakamiensis]MBP2000320.1 DNA-binding LacI/PurR family transcriptional regulator [Paenibacillus shirakamiensis]